MDNHTCLCGQTELFPTEETGGISLEEVFEAYFACRRKKRGTHNALAFEADYERKCIELWRDINAGTYKPSRSVAFIVFKPVQREVFAADFRDRVVHHLVARKIEPLLEAEFIDDSYSTRKEKGTLYGIHGLATDNKQRSYMTEQELIKKQEEGGNSTLYLMKVGMFFHAYEAGAFALARLMHYRVKRKARKGGREVLMAGFPADRLEVVAERIVAAGGKVLSQTDT